MGFIKGDTFLKKLGINNETNEEFVSNSFDSMSIDDENNFLDSKVHIPYANINGNYK
jgi:hypothetical protein